MNEFIETLVQDQERAVKEERRVKKSGAVGDGEMVEWANKNQSNLKRKGSGSSSAGRKLSPKQRKKLKRAQDLLIE
ncbi:hypothetical protein TrCOL_g9002 [Triparma columacea]|uniref:Uncharacterized protein n=1 Tax=Triparma columacea TaxID=722753 RepID=A0A9W7L5C4_9STRA|nr:hypothetical protein TrCOL_g9002 [Triparma columacea]